MLSITTTAKPAETQRMRPRIGSVRVVFGVGMVGPALHAGFNHAHANRSQRQVWFPGPQKPPQATNGVNTGKRTWIGWMGQEQRNQRRSAVKVKPHIVAEGEHIRYTAQGIVLAAEFSRAISATCLECSHQDPLRLVADEPLDDDECDRILTEYLEGLGWECEDEGDVCPECVETS